ncbi:MAG: hypothetical protein JXK93_00490 [Sphaerochaetaceae bacterium]|nr:hypothetical protein [Sphaerochaetaceae bacterium]
MIRQLHLHQELEYWHPIQFESSDTSVGTAYEAVLAHLETAPVGTDYLITCMLRIGDELTRADVIGITVRHPKETETPITAIPTGSYSFQQLPFTPESKLELLPFFMKFISTAKVSTAYIRIYKEKRFETAIQFFSPDRRN